MKKLFRWLLVGLVILIAALWFGADYFARKSLEVGVTKVTGFPLTIGSFHLNPAGHQIDVRDLKMMNPPGFEEPLFADMPLLHIDYDLMSMFGGVPHLNDLTVNIKQLFIVKDRQGETNVSKLKGSNTASNESSTKSKYRIDQFHLIVGSVAQKDYSSGKLAQKNLPANLDVTYHDLTDATDVNRLVLIAVMSKLHLQDIGVEMATLTKGISQHLLAPMGDILKGTIEFTGTVFKGSTNLIQKTGKGIYDIFKPKPKP